MLRDPLIAYAIQHSAASQSLVSMAETKHDDAVADVIFQRYLDAAIAGSAFAMCLCSRLYECGWGTHRSAEQAYVWAEKAADSGFPPGLYELGHCLERGIGTDKNMEAAVNKYLQAFAAGFGFAGVRLGRGFHAGDFGAVDIGKALRYMEEAQQLGESSAAYELAQWHESGDRVPRDYAAAVDWYERASDLGDPFGSHRLQIAYSEGELGLPRDPERAQHYEQRFNAQIA